MPTRRDGLKLLLAASLLPLAACGGGGGGGGTAARSAGGDVLDVARANGARRFVGALGKAGFSERLSGPGPYTLFAPTDRAISAAGLPSDPGALSKLVAYHVVPGDFTVAFLSGVDINYTTLAGTSLNVDGTGSGLTVNGVPVTLADLEASNGVVHLIGGVLKPR
ncbi:MAG: fasciclin domain-containing protein [Amaricoccus sp.]|uniref:fasciclin domain-containing protein n=1 Tax=Amaricoccus sp. TaxID=1872485 RepID=UPI0039E5DA18